METFRPFFAFAETVSNIADDNSNHSERDHSLNTRSLDTHEEEQYEELMPENVASPRQSRYTDGEHTLSENNTKRRKRTAKRLVPEENSSVNAVLEYLKNKRSAPSMDAIDIMFQGYAQSLKQFSPQRQAKVKIKIATIMAEEEMLHQQEQILSSECTHSSFQSSSTSSNATHILPSPEATFTDITGQYNQSSGVTSFRSSSDSSHVAQCLSSPEATYTDLTTQCNEPSTVKSIVNNYNPFAL